LPEAWLVAFATTHKGKPVSNFDLDHFLPYQLAVLASRISREFSTLYQARFDISIPEWRVIAHLSQAGAVSVREIHLKVDMDKSKVSRAAARLEVAGYISKCESKIDRRLVDLELTPKGRTMVAEIMPLADAFEARVLAELGPDAGAFRQAVAQLLSRS